MNKYTYDFKMEMEMDAEIKKLHKRVHTPKLFKIGKSDSNFSLQTLNIEKLSSCQGL